MNAPQTGPREVVAGLAEVLLPALAAGATALARAAARDVASLMGFEGLDLALVQLERHAGAARPVDVEHLAERIARIVQDAVRTGELSAFRDADRELGALASQVAETSWSSAADRSAPVVPTWEVGETLADLTLDATPEVTAARLTMNVASALRAATDWLGADEAPRVVANIHDSALTLTLPVPHEGGIGPAGAVLAAVEGSMGRDADGRWTLRVPRCTERPSFLLVRQGRFGFALPWHAVARLRMFAPHELDRLVEPRLDPLAALAPTTSERPAAMVALGLARAWFIADRIVWRIAAVPEDAETAGPFAGTTRVVSVESGERYWVLEPGWLLRGVVPPDVAPPAPRARVRLTAVDSVPAPAPAPAPQVAPVPAAEPTPRAATSLADAAERALEALQSERMASVRAAAEHEWRASAGRLAEAPCDTSAVEVDAATMIDAAFTFDPAPAAAEVPAPAVIAPPEEPVEYLVSCAPALALEPEAPLAMPASEAPLAQSPIASGSAAVEFTAADAVMFGEGPMPGEMHHERPSEIAEHTPARRALIADDSLVARIFLGRLLEKRGWVVESVPDAATLWNELRQGSWALVCADFALPDAVGQPHVQRLVDHLARRATPSTFIVLTRDAEEERIAREAGATLTLRKPFDPAHLASLLAR